MGSVTSREDPVPPADEIAWFEVTSSSGAAKPRRTAVNLGERLGLGEARAGELAVVVNEVGSNLAKYARGGWLGVRPVRHHDARGVEIIALDSGPGIPDLSLSRRDGYSTTGTLGIGLGAIDRLSTWYDIHSVPGRGTVLAARFFARDRRSHGSTSDGLTRPIAGEPVSGDRFAVRERPEGPLLLVADGLGHGLLAADAAAAALAAFRGAANDSPVAIVEEIHDALGRTRGAAVGVASLERDAGLVRFAGLGNIAGFVLGEKRQAMASTPGIAGHQRGVVRERSIPITSDAVVVLHSDGVSTNWDLSAYPGLLGHSSVLIAGTVLRDAGVRRDDACVLVAKAYT